MRCDHDATLGDDSPLYLRSRMAWGRMRNGRYGALTPPAASNHRLVRQAMAELPHTIQDDSNQGQRNALWDEVVCAYEDAEEADRAARQAWAVFQQKRAIWAEAFGGAR